jgi:hypothetical protein
MARRPIITPIQTLGGYVALRKTVSKSTVKTKVNMVMDVTSRVILM